MNKELKQLLISLRAKRKWGSIVCVSGELEEIKNYYKLGWFTREPITSQRMLREYEAYSRQFAFVYGDESCIPDPRQRAQALHQPYVPNDPRYYARMGDQDLWTIDDPFEEEED